MNAIVKKNQAGLANVAPKAIKELAKKEDMTLPEALEVIDYYDSKLATAKNAIPIRPIDGIAYSDNPLPHIVVVASLAFSTLSLWEGVFEPRPELAEWDLIFDSSIVFFASIIGGFAAWGLDSKFTKRTSSLWKLAVKLVKPRKARKWAEDYRINKEFHDLAVAEHAAMQEKAVKRAKRALAVANANLKTEEIVLKDGRFVVKEKNISSVRKVLLREQDEPVLSLKAGPVSKNEDAKIILASS